MGLAVVVIFQALWPRVAGADDALRLDLVRPVYRQSLYATETDPSIVAWPRWAAGAAAPGTVVQARLIDAAGRVRAVAGPAGVAGGDLRFDGSMLEAGLYTIEARAVAADGKETARAQVTVRKLDTAPGSEVRVDGLGNIVVNGKPKVFIGWYGTVPVDDPRPEVVALQNLQTPVVVSYPDPSPVARAFRARGVYSIVSLDPVRLFAAFGLSPARDGVDLKEPSNRDTVSEACLGCLQRMIRLLQDERGLLGWYIADEPEGHKVRPAYLEHLYRTVRALDPYHPVFVTNDTVEGIETVGYRCCDILVPDPYSPKPDYVPRFLRQANRLLGPGQTTMLTPWQACGQTHFTEDFGSKPPYGYRVTRGQYLAAVALGCRGFAGYSTDFFLPEPTLRYGLPSLWRAIRLLEPAMAAAAPGSSPSASEGLITWLRKVDDHVYLIVMNPTPQAVLVAVSHALLGPLDTLFDVDDGRDVPVRGGVVMVAAPLGPGEARLYTTDPAGQRLETVDQVEVEIARQAAAAHKPGNLLLAAAGASARVSGGTVPWFQRYFYYAINGITDDAGWHVTHAPLPQWLEITLPREQPIGRVVLYTPNLGAYDLLFRAADGATRIAEVRNPRATQGVIEHHFRPALPTLKLRVVAHAVREGAWEPKAMVREIEAYSEPGDGPATPTRGVDSPAAAPDLRPIFADADGPATLWSDDFRPFRQSPLRGALFDDAWVLNLDDFVATPGDGQVTCTSRSKQGYASMSRILPYDPAYRFYQVRVRSITGDGYRFFTSGFGESSGKLKVRGAVTANRPGLYTVDTHALHPDFQSGRQRNCFVTLFVNNGTNFTFDLVRLARRPIDGLVVTRGDGAPLPERLGAGDALRFTLLLRAPAEDAVVEVFRDSTYTLVPLNGAPYVQLFKSNRERDGRAWSAVVKLGARNPGLGPGGYPIVFRASLTGGPLRETFHTAFVHAE